MKTTFRVEQYVTVEVDEAKFTPEFMAEFQRHFYPFKTVEDHMNYFARMYVTGQIQGWADEFVEGYGELGEFGVEITEGSEVTAEVDD